MSFAPVIVGSETWTFDHLAPHSFPYSIETGGRVVTLSVDVSYSCHCFSRDPGDGEVPPAELLYEHGKDHRILDAVRYEFSKRLPGLIADIDQRRILFAGPENFLTLEATDAEGVAGYYQVFFVLYRKVGTKQRLELRVQSAYWVSHLHRRARPTTSRKVRFKLIATAAYEGRRLHAAR
jgi:hypothetical protein